MSFICRDLPLFFDFLDHSSLFERNLATKDLSVVNLASEYASSSKPASALASFDKCWLVLKVSLNASGRNEVRFSGRVLRAVEDMVNVTLGHKLKRVLELQTVMMRESPTCEPHRLLRYHVTFVHNVFVDKVPNAWN